MLSTNDYKYSLIDEDELEEVTAGSEVKEEEKEEEEEEEEEVAI